MQQQVTKVDAFFFGAWCTIVNDRSRKQLNLTRSEGEGILGHMRKLAPFLPRPVTFKRNHGVAPMTRRPVRPSTVVL